MSKMNRFRFLIPFICMTMFTSAVTVPADETSQGWYEDSEGWRYIKEDGEDAWLEWVEDNSVWYYFDENGYMMKDTFFTSWDNLYYAGEDGGMYCGSFFEKDGQFYYACDWGGLARGWFMTDDIYHYADPDTGAMYFNSFLDLENQLYYIDENGNMVTGWQTIGDDTYYFEPWGGACRNATMTQDGMVYQFDEEGHLVSQAEAGTDDNSDSELTSGTENANASDTENAEASGDTSDAPENTSFDGDALLGVHTIQNLLANAILPVGNTLYVWGGGHADPDYNRSGLNPQWSSYFDGNDATYNPDEHEYEYGNGLDCSGYVGWVGYQVVQESVVTDAVATAANYGEHGWGTYEANYSGDYYPGDICNKSCHAWIVIGQCDDGSVVLAHSNLAYVQISGTVKRDGDANSEAIALATEYMSRYYPEAYARYGIMMNNTTYLDGTYHFSWSEEFMSDVSDMRSKTPREILQILFHEV